MGKDNPLDLLPDIIKAVTSNQAFDLGFDAIGAWFIIQVLPELIGWEKPVTVLIGLTGILWSLQSNKRVRLRGTTPIKNITPGRDALTGHGKAEFINDLKQSSRRKKTLSKKQSKDKPNPPALPPGAT